MRDKLGVAAALLLAGVAAQFAWKLAPVAKAGAAWNAGQALFLCACLLLLLTAYESRQVRLVCLMLLGWQGLTAGCQIAWWMNGPWVVMPGDGLCTAKMNLPLGIVGAGLALWIALGMLESMRRRE